MSDGDSKPASIVELLLSEAGIPGSSSHTAPATRSYITHLTSLPLETILTEPGRLETESSLLSGDLTALCQTNHTTFLSLQSASRALSTSLTSLTYSLDSILNDCIPSLESASHEFSQNTKSIQESRSKASLVLEHHEKLVDVLELPHLLATCIKNGYYSEAMDLAEHFEKDLLGSLPPTTLLESIHTSVVASLQTLLQQLLQQLRSPAKLPSLFKTINLLRRMEVCSEEQLALAFILGRSFHLDDAFANANASNERDKEEDPARWLRKWIEVFREGVYDVITQFSTIFLPSPAPTVHRDAVPNDGAILKSILGTFTQTYVTLLLTTLHSTLPNIPIQDMTSVSSLITQLSYCASSFARVGLDFRIALQPVVEDSVLSIFGNALREALDSLRKTSSGAASSRRRLEDWLIDEEYITSLASSQRRQGPVTSLPTSNIPPSSITAIPPLAFFINDILTALNGLRLVAMPSVYTRVELVLHDVLLESGDMILAGIRSVVASSIVGDDRKRIKYVFEAMWASNEEAESGALPYICQGLRRGVYANWDKAPATPIALEEKWDAAKRRWLDWANDIGLSLEGNPDVST